VSTKPTTSEDNATNQSLDEKNNPDDSNNQSNLQQRNNFSFRPRRPLINPLEQQRIEYEK
jgi:hypothetical protein